MGVGEVKVRGEVREKGRGWCVQRAGGAALRGGRDKDWEDANGS